MIVGLLWIFGCYAAGIALVHWMHRVSKPKHRRNLTHYVLMTRNNGLHMEWYLRSLYFFSGMKGRNISVTVVDEGSSDETLEIVRRIGSEKEVEILIKNGIDAIDDVMTDHFDEHVVVVRLSEVTDVRDMPLLMQ
ncbi:hypothetical protein [Paenibacillus thalictri]|uniref:Glycosyltransferase n=1 Tax=Paenibacillus thalictri TaxID=2527873 RepID=A0A4Q9DMG6_9BACL|nr:hypothetical protein [Paenibacillus thalictri]TBL72986.1 hypothetical protein EYB31_27555 [Paenibacillus thalictri]